MYSYLLAYNNFDGLLLPRKDKNITIIFLFLEQVSAIFR